MDETGASNPSATLTRYAKVPAGVHPPLLARGYRSTAARAPQRSAVELPQLLTEITGPLLGAGRVTDADADLTAQHDVEPVGQRIVVQGQVRDSGKRPVPHTLLEVWQANAAGRYRHVVDQWPAPLDPGFSGVGRALTDGEGRYRFVTVKPGAYPWGNHHNAWRPAHIHFSLFGRAFTQRLVTQMYFPDDPLFGQDPIFGSVPEQARHRLVSRFSLEASEPQWALTYVFDIVLRGADATPWEEHDQEDAQ